MLVDEGQLEESVSQISYLGPSFHFKNSRKEKALKNVIKLPVLCHKIKTEASIRNMRHASLDKNLHRQFQEHTQTISVQ